MAPPGGRDEFESTTVADGDCRISLLATGIAAHAEGAGEGTKLITLGTAGGPQPRKDRAQASNLLVVNGTLYLIDAGDSVTRRIVQAGYDFRKIGKIFITHPHSDHTAGSRH